MIPVQHNIKIYQGDTYYGELITLPSLVTFGGPEDLSDPVEVAAQIRETADAEEALADFEVEVLDAVERQVRLTLIADDTADLPASSTDAVWDLEVTDGEWVGTPIGGKAKVLKQVTRP